MSVIVVSEGYYAIDGKRNVPCLIYATTNQHIRMYYDIRIDRIGISSLLENMKQHSDAPDLLKFFNCQGSTPFM